MYDPVNKVSGVTAVSNWFNQFSVTSGADGLEMAQKAGSDPLPSVRFPPVLQNWLHDLRLLRGLPLCYLVPDARLLPPESIRFFHVDYTWLDRVIDGAYSAANLGTVDATFTYGSLQGVRDALDDDQEALAKSMSNVAWRPGSNPMTGCLIRSELIRRWPDIIVNAFSTWKNTPDGMAGTNPMAVLRAETVSSDVYIALFGGEPGLVQIQEPHVGTRFGVEANLKVDQRDSKGHKVMDAKKNPVSISVGWKDQGTRTLDISGVNGQLQGDKGPRMMALQFEQPAYIQDFMNNMDEAKGSVSPFILIQLNAGQAFMPLRRGRTMSLDKFTERFTEAEQQRKK